MGRQKQKGEVEVEVSVKGAIVDERGWILTLTKAKRDPNRNGLRDWGGGIVLAGEDLIEGLLREIEQQELPGTRLENLVAFPEGVWEKSKEGRLIKITHFIGANAIFPEGGIVTGSELSDDYDWLPREDYANLDIPNKYKHTVASPANRGTFDLLAMSAQMTAESLGDLTLAHS